MNIFNLLNRFRKANKGVAAIEFALLAPIYITLMLSVVEASNWLYASQKFENAANNILNIMNQETQLKNENLKTLAEMIPLILKPVDIKESDYGLVVTSVQSDKPGEKRLEEPYVFWQEKLGNSSLVSPMLKYNAGGANKDNIIPKGSLRNFNFTDGDQIILVEVAMKYTPLITSYFAPELSTKLEYFTFARPRKGAFAFRPDELD